MIDNHSSTESRPREVIIALNPKSGTGQRQAQVQRLRQSLAEIQFDVEVISDLDQLTQRVGQALSSGTLHTVVAAGGDGTIGLLVNRLPASTPFTIFPLGTENLLAKYLGISGEVRQSVEIIRQNRIVDIDAGEANGTLFLVMASCGLDADVVRRLAARRTGHIWRGSYARPLWESVFGYRYPQLRIVVDGHPWAEDPCWAFVFNVPRYAMNLPIVPEANAFDGRLDLRTFRHGSLARGLMYLMNIVLGRHTRSQDCLYAQAQSIEISSLDDQPVTYQLDGDPGGELPVRLSSQPGRVKLLVPAAFVANPT